MDGSSSDTERTRQDPDRQDPPGAVSNQNREEGEGGLAGTGERPGDEADTGGEGAPAGSGTPEPAGSPDSGPGSATEGSQATGHPENAG